MPQKNAPTDTTRITREILNIIFQVLVNEVSNNPSIILTRHKLQLQVPVYPEATVLGCIMTYQHDGHIACSRNRTDIVPKNMDTDYEEFHLTTSVNNSSSVYAGK